MLIQGDETRIAGVKFAPEALILVAAPGCLSAETKFAARVGGQTVRPPFCPLYRQTGVFEL
jgi:hypothetical protein